MEVGIENNEQSVKNYKTQTESVYIITKSGHYQIFELYKLFSEANLFSQSEIFNNISADPCVIIVLKSKSCIFYNNNMEGTNVCINGQSNTNCFIKIRKKVVLTLRLNGKVYKDAVFHNVENNPNESTFVYVKYNLSSEYASEDAALNQEKIRNLVIKHLKNYSCDIVTLDYSYSLVGFKNEFGVLHFVRVLKDEFSKLAIEGINVSFSAGIEYGKYDKYYDEHSNYFACFNGIALNKAARMSASKGKIVLGFDFYKRIRKQLEMYNINGIGPETWEMKGFERQDVYVCNFNE